MIFVCKSIVLDVNTRYGIRGTTSQIQAPS